MKKNKTVSNDKYFNLEDRVSSLENDMNKFKLDAKFREIVEIHLFRLNAINLFLLVITFLITLFNLNRYSAYLIFINIFITLIINTLNFFNHDYAILFTNKNGKRVVIFMLSLLFWIYLFTCYITYKFYPEVFNLNLIFCIATYITALITLFTCRSIVKKFYRSL